MRAKKLRNIFWLEQGFVDTAFLFEHECVREKRKKNILVTKPPTQRGKKNAQVIAKNIQRKRE
mgnify:CR=1 FL=1